MQGFTYFVPTKVIQGKGVVRENLGKIAAGYGKKAVILSYGDGVIQMIGAYDDAVESLKEAGVDYIYYDKIEPNPLISTVEDAIRVCREEGVDMIVAIGGGSVIDSAKCIAGCFHYDGPAIMITRDPAIVKDPLPILAIPTLAATGSDMDNSGMIHDEELHCKKRTVGGDPLYPKVSLQDPSYTLKLPMKQTAAGIADIVSHISEGYFAKQDGLNYSDNISEALMKTAIECGKILAKDPENYDARANLLFTASWGCNGLSTCGRAFKRWSVHPIEHELAGVYNDPHGQGIAIITLVWMQYVLDHFTDEMKDQFARFAVNVMGVEPKASAVETAQAGIDELASLYHAWGIPKNLRESGIGITDDSKFEYMTEIAMGPTGAITGAVTLSKEDIINIYRAAL